MLDDLVIAPHGNKLKGFLMLDTKLLKINWWSSKERKFWFEVLL